jgi:hypothetical protein
LVLDKHHVGAALRTDPNDANACAERLGPANNKPMLKNQEETGEAGSWVEVDYAGMDASSQHLRGG